MYFNFRKESRIITQASLIYGCNASLSYIMTAILGFVTFSTYAGLGNALNPQRIFTSLTLLNFAKLIFVDFVIISFLQITELSVSLKRIEVKISLCSDILNGTSYSYQCILYLYNLHQRIKHLWTIKS